MPGTAQGRSQAGACARELAALLRVAGEDRLLATAYRRAQETLAPLAAVPGLEVKILPAADLEAWKTVLEALPPGSTALIAGHSKTLPALARALGTEIPDRQEGRLPHQAHGRLTAFGLAARGWTGTALRPALRPQEPCACSRSARRRCFRRSLRRLRRLRFSTFLSCCPMR